MEQWSVVATLPVLPPDITIATDHPRVVHANILPDDVLSEVGNTPIYCKHILTDADDKFYVMERYGKEYWVIWIVEMDKHSITKLIDLIEFSDEVTTKEFGSTNGYQSIDEINNYGTSKAEWDEIKITKIFNSFAESTKDRKIIGNSSELFMTLPSNNEQNKNTRTETCLVSDPKIYFNQRYYSTLFELDNAITYFVKSHLPRVRNLFKANTSTSDYLSQYIALIKSSLIPVRNFDERHTLNGLTTLLSTFDPNSEILELLTASQNLTDDSLGNDLSEKMLMLSVLKYRELKIQVVLLLEMMHLLSLDEQFDSFEKQYKNKLEQRSRNVNRSSFMQRRSRTRKNPSTSRELDSPKGNDINNNNDNNSNNNVNDGTFKITTQTDTIQNNIFDFYELLDIYLDKLLITDILMSSTNLDNNNTDSESDQPEENMVETKKYNFQHYMKRILDKNDEASVVGFVNYTLIPYYNRKAPNTIKFIIQKLKGPSMRKQPLKRITTGNTVNESTPLMDNSFNDFSNINNGTDPLRASSVQYASSEKNKEELRSSSPSRKSTFLSQRANSNLTDFIEKEGSVNKRLLPISRTTSDISFLEKRQFAVDNSRHLDSQNPQVSTTSDKNTQPKMSNSISRLKQQSFRRVGRNKSIFKKSTDATSSFAFSHKSIKEVNETNTIQVLSTPMGKRQSNLKAQEQSPLIIESPDAGIIAKSQTNVKGNSENNNTKTSIPPNKKVKRRLFAP
ncbi:uncharacterized protein HLK63_F06809 [Nakaseomyces glabratus]|nr:uncharacterized protein GW608_F06809 [Nakaseomyces glabratus]UCS25484.1 uncharacterized protein HLK63_F06809 [Nakaseomyces glabratus]UCS30714.1 uncharacterized protein HLK64_F06809 [Nakaseomyces glabratus]UCS35943.1 uncharacterized protein HLK62_F06809 [Nakaseomyces glabratus]